MWILAMWNCWRWIAAGSMQCKLAYSNSQWIIAHEVARLRGCSLNTLVNSVVWAAFGAQRRASVASSQPKKREAPVPEVCLESA